MDKNASFGVTGPPLTEKKTLAAVSEQAEPTTFSTTKPEKDAMKQAWVSLHSRSADRQLLLSQPLHTES